MTHAFYSLISVFLFALVHVFAEKIPKINRAFHGKFLSIGSGVALAYVFIDLLPKLAISDLRVKEILQEFLPFIEKHAYVLALFGFLLFLVVDRSQSASRKKSVYFSLSLSSYALFNFLVGYAIVDKANPDIQPLFLFTFAMVLHYFTNDYTLSETDPKRYNHMGKGILVAALFLGWLTGAFFQISTTAITLVSAFIGGGVIMNVMRHELPKENPHNLGAFLIAAMAYTAILLMIGQP